MSMSGYRVSAQIAVSDLAKAAEFYEGKLGLSAGAGTGDSRAYPCGAGTILLVYASPANAGKSTATVANWEVANIEQVVDDLTANGVTFEQYGDPVPTDEKGIHYTGYSKIAWFKDPDGNTFEVAQT